MKHTQAEIAVVVPCYQCLDHIEGVLTRIGPEVSRIIVVDDACPQDTGRHVEALRLDRVTVLYQNENTGVGGAVLRGMVYARETGADILVKIDGDGQMAPELVNPFVAPILAGQADYTKGNRFFTYHLAKNMPIVRFIGNSILSFLTKLSSGYWNVFDPTNGYVAISGAVFDELALDRIHKRYFFETDILCNLNLLRAVVMDIPIQAIYGSELSGLSPASQILPFFWHNMTRFLRRVLYTYFIRDFSIGSLYLVTGIPLLAFGLIFGIMQWITTTAIGIAASTGTIMLATLPFILGFILILNFLLIDMMTIPKEPLHPKLRQAPDGPSAQREATRN